MQMYLQYLNIKKGHCVFKKIYVNTTHAGWHSICQIISDTFTDLMSTASSHHQLEKNVEEEQGERFKFEDNVKFGEETGNAVCRDKTGVECIESQTHSVKLDTTLKNTENASQDNITGSPAGQENASSYSKYF